MVFLLQQVVVVFQETIELFDVLLLCCRVLAHNDDHGDKYYLYFLLGLSKQPNIYKYVYVCIYIYMCISWVFILSYYAYLWRRLEYFYIFQALFNYQYPSVYTCCHPNENTNKTFIVYSLHFLHFILNSTFLCQHIKKKWEMASFNQRIYYG